MRELWTTLQMILTAVGGFFGYFIGGLDGFLYALIAFVVIDYVTGIMVAIVQKNLSSEIGFKGIFKKVITFAFVAIANIIDIKLIGDGSTIRTAVIFFYLSNEGVSIIENAGSIGLPIPERLKNVLIQLKDNSKQNNEKDNEND